jgi:hypothetical protein
LNDQTQELRIAPQPEEKRHHWYLLTGLIIGIAAGLIITWLLFPVVYQDTSPASLSPAYKEIYRGTIAQVHTTSGNLERAVGRLALLEDEDIIYALGAQAQRALADGQEKEARALALLASEIQAVIPPETSE